MALPNPGMAFSPFDILTAEEMNSLVENIEALAAGTGLNTGAITAVKTAFGGNYSTTEVNTGFTWVNGSEIYKKTINFGALPNNAPKDVAHGVTGLVTMVTLYGMATSGTISLPLPYSGSGTGSNANSIQVARSGNNIQILTGSDRTGYSGFVTMYYTKV